jgi:hypothetical protein
VAQAIYGPALLLSHCNMNYLNCGVFPGFLCLVMARLKESVQLPPGSDSLAWRLRAGPWRKRIPITS